MHVISESALIPFTQNYQNQSMLVETTAFQQAFCSPNKT